MKRAGGIRGREYTPTVDGNFDRISTEIDPAFGTEDEYQAMVRHARDNGAVVIGDIIPGHSGKGADFRLAERRLRRLPGPLPHGGDPAEGLERAPRRCRPARTRSTSSPTAVDAAQGARLHRRAAPAHHLLREGRQGDRLVGHRRRRRRRRQEPPLGLPALLQGRAAHLQLARPHLRRAAAGRGGRHSTPWARWASACCASTPTASSASRSARTTAAPGPRGTRSRSPSNQLIAGLVRKLGGFTFQELNLTLEDIKAMSQGGADLSYDFVTRPGLPPRPRHRRCRVPASHARRCRRPTRSIRRASSTRSRTTTSSPSSWCTSGPGTRTPPSPSAARPMKGSALREIIRAEMHGRLIGPAAPYNLKAANGVSCTTATVAAAALGIRDVEPSHRGAAARHPARPPARWRMYNAMQPGVFALSGWDLVGALTLPAESVKTLLADGDTRWINRGAYDLLGTDSGRGEVEQPICRAPRRSTARCPSSSSARTRSPRQLKKMLRVRARVPHQRERAGRRPGGEGPGPGRHGPPASRRQGHPGHGDQLRPHGRPGDGDHQDRAAGRRRSRDLLADKALGKLGAGGRLPLALGPHEGQVLLIK